MGANGGGLLVFVDSILVLGGSKEGIRRNFVFV